MKSTLEYLYSLQKFGMKFGLQNIRKLLHSIGNPHNSFKAIHVAGTNGKGSTSSMIAAILTAAGYKVGLYTSPHLVKFNERIRINGKMISDKNVVKYTNKLKPQINKLRATFFETTTAIAFKYFSDQKVDFAVIETGLGGRLDSTNVIRPLVSVITSIGKDHTEILGNTINSISKEKAGIIKPSIPVVVGNIKGPALNVFSQSAKKNRSPLLISSKISLSKKINLQLKGEHQIANAKAAVGAITIIANKFIIGDNAIEKGLHETNQLSGLRGRFEFIRSKQPILLDVAHNPDGIKVLVKEIHKLRYQKIVVLFAAMKDKDYRSSLKQLRKLKPFIIATQPLVERALPAEQLAEVCKELKLECIFTNTVQNAVKLGMKLSEKKGLFVITGSHFLVGEAIPLLGLNKKNA
jgi:dihydrofolate synthase/folylpolyglutamate synthase